MVEWVTAWEQVSLVQKSLTSCPHWVKIVWGTLSILVRQLEAVREDLSHPLEEPLKRV